LILKEPPSAVPWRGSSSAGRWAYRIVRVDPLRFVFKVPQELVSRFRKGAPLRIKVNGRILKGRVSYISPSADENRLFTVKALLSNRDGSLKPNTYGEVFFSLKRIKAVAVPEQAVQLSRQQTFLWVVRDSRAVKVPVQVIQHRGDKLIVSGELKEKDRVVVEGLLFLYEGAKVRER